jgi:hypothetical protein
MVHRKRIVFADLQIQWALQKFEARHRICKILIPRCRSPSMSRWFSMSQSAHSCPWIGVPSQLQRPRGMLRCQLDNVSSTHKRRITTVICYMYVAIGSHQSKIPSHLRSNNYTRTSSSHGHKSLQVHTPCSKSVKRLCLDPGNHGESLMISCSRGIL